MAGEAQSYFWGDPSGNIRRISGEQEIVAKVTAECTREEWRALCDAYGPRAVGEDQETLQRAILLAQPSMSPDQLETFTGLIEYLKERVSKRVGAGD
jgi:hypothetical protein